MPDADIYISLVKLQRQDSFVITRNDGENIGRLRQKLNKIEETSDARNFLWISWEKFSKINLIDSWIIEWAIRWAWISDWKCDVFANKNSVIWC